MPSPEATQAYYAALDRAKEDLRQQQIESGLSQLSRIFEGGAYGTGQVNPDDLRAGQRYYTATGDEFVLPYTAGSNPAGAGLPPGALSFAQWRAKHPYYSAFPNIAYIPAGSTGAQEPASRMYDEYLSGLTASATGPAATTLRQAIPDELGFTKQLLTLPSLYTGRAETAGFGPDFYNRKRDAYLEFATPQLQDQYAEARAQVADALSRAGTSSSSMAARRTANLARDYGLRQQEIADTAQNYAKEAERNVEAARTEAARAVQSGGDLDEAARGALAAANELTTRATNYSPLGALFTNASAGLAGYMEGARYDDMRQRLEREYNIAPASSTGSGRIVKG